MKSVPRIRRSPRSVIRWGFGVSLSLAGASHAAAQSCEPLRPNPSDVPTQVAPLDLYGFSSAVTRGETPIDLGVGHLYWSGEEPGPPGSNAWLLRMIVPLWSDPTATPIGWIVNGWVIRNGLPDEPLDVAALVETGYEEPSFIVHEEGADGWLRIQLLSMEGGTHWTRPCAMSHGSDTFDYAPWGSWLSDQPLFFRSSPAVPRSGPSESDMALAEIGESYTLQPLEVRGDWMRVEIREPSDACGSEVVPAIRTGWIRWFSEDVGPLVWYPTRGC